MRVDQEQLPRKRDPLVVGAVAIVAVLAAALVVWLGIGILTDSTPSRMTVELENQTGLTLNVEAVDAEGDVTALGRIEPGAAKTRVDVPVPSSEWTYVARYADEEVWRSDPVTPEVAAGGTSSARIEETPEIQELAEQGFQ